MEWSSNVKDDIDAWSGGSLAGRTRLDRQRRPGGFRLDVWKVLLLEADDTFELDGRSPIFITEQSERKAKIHIASIDG